MKIRLDSVRLREEDTLFRLLQYSLFEESAGDLNEMNDDALYDYPWFKHYFTDDNRWAYLIREQETDKLLGFVMVKTQEEPATGYTIAEFMVIPKYRRRSVGRQAAVACFDRFQGNWKVSPAMGSDKAYAFWKNVIDAYTGGNNRFEDDAFLFSNL